MPPWPLLLTTLALGACSVADSHAARRAETALLGLSEMDLETCLGVPNRKDKFGQTSILSYDGSSTNSGGLSLTLPVVGGVSFSGGGYCHLNARLDEDRVTSIQYTGETDAVFSPEAYCAPLIRSCLAHPARALTATAAPAAASRP